MSKRPSSQQPPALRAAARRAADGQAAPPSVLAAERARLVRQSGPNRIQRMPPLVFAPLVALIWSVMALQEVGPVAGIGTDMLHGVAQVAAGMVAALLGFAIFAYLRKLTRDPSVLQRDARPLPGAFGLLALGIVAWEGGWVLSLHETWKAGGWMLAAAGAGIMLLVAGTSRPRVTPLAQIWLALGVMMVPVAGAAPLGAVLAVGVIVATARTRVSAALRPLWGLHVVALAFAVGGLERSGWLAHWSLASAWLVPVLASLGAGFALWLWPFGKGTAKQGMDVPGALFTPAVAMGVAAAARLWPPLVPLGLCLGVWSLVLIWRAWGAGRLAVLSNAAEAR